MRAVMTRPANPAAPPEVEQRRQVAGQRGEREADRQQHEERHVAELLDGEAAALVHGNVADRVEPVLQRVDGTEPGPQRGQDADDEDDAAAGQRLGVGELGPDHGDLAEGAGDEVLAELLVVAQHDAEDRHEHQEQGEDAEEGVVRHRRREPPAVVLAEALEHRERQRHEAMALLEAVEPVDRGRHDAPHGGDSTARAYHPERAGNRGAVAPA